MTQAKHEGYADSFPYLYLSPKQHLTLHVKCLKNTEKGKPVEQLKTLRAGPWSLYRSIPHPA